MRLEVAEVELFLESPIPADLGVAGEAGSAPGAGAAGGLGAGCRAFLGAELDLGASWCARLARFGEGLEGASGVITGEGRFDDQSGGGKVTGYVIAEAYLRIGDSYRLDAEAGKKAQQEQNTKRQGK